MKRLIIAALLFATPALAQPVPMQQQLDSMVATVNRAVVQMSGQIALDQEKIAALQKALDEAKTAKVAAP